MTKNELDIAYALLSRLVDLINNRPNASTLLLDQLRDTDANSLEHVKRALAKGLDAFKAGRQDTIAKAEIVSLSSLAEKYPALKPLCKEKKKTVLKGLLWINDTPTSLEQFLKALVSTLDEQVIVRAEEELNRRIPDILDELEEALAASRFRLRRVLNLPPSGAGVESEDSDDAEDRFKCVTCGTPYDMRELKECPSCFSTRPQWFNLLESLPEVEQEDDAQNTGEKSGKR